MINPKENKEGPASNRRTATRIGILGAASLAIGQLLNPESVAAGAEACLAKVTYLRLILNQAPQGSTNNDQVRYIADHPEIIVRRARQATADIAPKSNPNQKDTLRVTETTDGYGKKVVDRRVLPYAEVRAIPDTTKKVGESDRNAITTLVTNRRTGFTFEVKAACDCFTRAVAFQVEASVPLPQVPEAKPTPTPLFVPPKEAPPQIPINPKSVPKTGDGSSIQSNYQDIQRFAIEDSVAFGGETLEEQDYEVGDEYVEDVDQAVLKINGQNQFISFGLPIEAIRRSMVWGAQN